MPKRKPPAKPASKQPAKPRQASPARKPTRTRAEPTADPLEIPKFLRRRPMTDAERAAWMAGSTRNRSR